MNPLFSSHELLAILVVGFLSSSDPSCCRLLPPHNRAARRPPSHSPWTRAWSSPPPPSILPPSARSGAAEPCGVDWRSSSPSVDPTNQGAIPPRFGLGFTSSFLFLSLVRNPSRLPSLFFLCEQGQRSRKDQIFPPGLCSKRRDGKKERKKERKNPPFPLLFFSFSPFRSVCTGLGAVLRISV